MVSWKFRRALVALLVLVALLLPGTAGEVASGPVLWRDAGRMGDTGAAFTPAGIQAAYDFSPLYRQGLDGAGQTVVLIEVDSFNPADITEFDRMYRLPDPAIIQRYIGASRFALQSGAETTIDVEWMHALAPAASIQVYYLNNDASRVSEQQGWRAMASALRTAVAQGATAVSMSLNACRPGAGFLSTSSALASLVRRGVSVFVSSGDSGAHPGPVADCGRRVGVAYPASDPSVVGVGGTRLAVGAGGGISDEVAWSLSGGGKVTRMARSPWQAERRLPPDRYRWAPDVAFVADPQTGVSVYFQGAWRQVGGTSVGAPAWTAAWALILQGASRAGKSVGAAPAMLYRVACSPAYPRAFHDIIRGGNRHYRAGQGWDAVTGLGTPDVAGLAAAIQGMATAS